MTSQQVGLARAGDLKSGMTVNLAVGSDPTITPTMYAWWEKLWSEDANKVEHQWSVTGPLLGWRYVLKVLEPYANPAEVFDIPSLPDDVPPRFVLLAVSNDDPNKALKEFEHELVLLSEMDLVSVQVAEDGNPLVIDGIEVVAV